MGFEAEPPPLRDLRPLQPPDQLLGFSRKHGSGNDFNTSWMSAMLSADLNLRHLQQYPRGFLTVYSRRRNRSEDFPAKSRRLQSPECPSTSRSSRPTEMRAAPL